MTRFVLSREYQAGMTIMAISGDVSMGAARVLRCLYRRMGSALCRGVYLCNLDCGPRRWTTDISDLIFPAILYLVCVGCV